MTELIMKMILCLALALLLGFIIGWLLSKLFTRKKNNETLDTLGVSLEAKNKQLEELEEEYKTEKLKVFQFTNENRELKGKVLQKTNLLEEKATRVLEVQKELDSVHSTNSDKHQEHNVALLEKITTLENSLIKKDREVDEYDKVLIKAEETIAEKERLLSKKDESANFFSQNVVGSVSKSDSTELEEEVEKLSLLNEEKSNSIVLYQDTITELEKELKLYSLNGENSEFVISKDQFTHIEDQLVEYQKEIVILKEKNKALTGSVKFSEKSTEEVEDDGSIVKLFRDTYKKITKP